MGEHSRLEEFPISFFSMIMGLAGLTVAWEKTASMFHFTYPIHLVFLGFTVVLFLILSTGYILKIFRHPEAVKAELHHPIKLSFFPSFSISLLLLSVTFLHISASISQLLWMTGTITHLVLLLYVLNSWMNHPQFKIQHMNPAWFIPAVGNVLVPITGTFFGYTEISWFFFSVGILFWLVLLTIVMNRVLFHDPLPIKLQPTLFILIAPPAVGFISYVTLTHGVDNFARILYYLALFFTLFLFTQVPRLAKVPFFLSWWAYSFPMAAITIATWVMYENTQLPLLNILAVIFLIILSCIVLVLLYKTSIAIKNKTICLPE